MTDKPKDGGPALKSCRICGQAYSPKPYQLAKGDYECPPFKRHRQNTYNTGRDLAAYKKIVNAQPTTKLAARAYNQKRKQDPGFVLARKAHRIVKTEIEAGRLRRQSCEVCGNEKTDAHHDDYTVPLDIRWLCRRHHAERHSMIAQGEKG